MTYAELSKKVSSGDIKVENVIDIRMKLERVIKGSKISTHIEMSKLQQSPEKYLSKDVVYYLVCASGNRSSSLSSILNKQGYQTNSITDGVS